MPCFSTTNTWFVTPQARSFLGEGFQANAPPKQYTIQLNRDFDCCHEQYQIIVNNQPLQHTLTCNIWSPLCCPGGDFGWEQDGHQFLLMYNSIGLLRTMKGFRLFVDGIDVESGLEFRAFWRSRGLQFVFFGLAFLIIGAILTCLFYFVISRGTRQLFVVGVGLMGAGSVYVVMGLIPILRKYDSARYQHGTAIYNSY